MAGGQSDWGPVLSSADAYAPSRLLAVVLLAASLQGQSTQASQGTSLRIGISPWFSPHLKILQSLLHPSSLSLPQHSTVPLLLATSGALWTFLLWAFTLKFLLSSLPVNMICISSVPSSRKWVTLKLCFVFPPKVAA